MNKSGWIHILEATIAVLIVAGVMMSVYSEQSAREVLSVEDYSYSLQNEILDEIAMSSDLRSDVMKVVVDLPGDPAYDSLDEYVAEKVPEGIGYLLRVCNLGDVNDYCKMDPIIFYATLDKDVFVEEVVVSAEIGDGEDAEYSPKKVRLFFWEGGFPEGYCRDDCMVGGSPLFCSSDFLKVLKSECGNFDSDPCLEYGTSAVVEEVCGVGELCVDGACVANLLSKRVCRERSYVVCDVCAETNYYPALCSGYDGGFESGDCNSGDDDEYSCWNFAGSWESDCALPADLPDCPDTLSSCDNFILYDTAVSTIVPCACVPTTWTSIVDLNTICTTDFVEQTSNCGNTRSVAGTKDCTPPAVAVLSASYSNLRYNEGLDPGCFIGNDKWVHYDMMIVETGDSTDAILGSRKRCYYWTESGVPMSSCDSLSTTMPASFGGNVVPAGESITGTNRWFCYKSGFNYDVTETFYSDSLGVNPIVDYTISVGA
ncbi:MAG: hypothetical protein EHM85_12735 [Desulfobacteraceae bacterium]|nr:MAG: hypothetical protein EHM85_12735 [Desulfobacteraceae bacterium]